MEPSRPDALAFDLYGTLIDVSAMGRELERPGVDAAALASSWRRHQLEISWLLSLMGRYEDFEAVTRHALDVALAELGIEEELHARQTALAGLLRLPAHEDAALALERLAGAGILLAILSNGSRPMLEAALDRPGLRDRFDELVSADEVAVYKPSPEVYRHGAARLGLRPGNVWLVSANPFDCAGAAAAGLGVVKVERGPSFSYPFAPPPTMVVSTLTEIADLLA